ncbi:MAG: methyltransferase family protein [Actinomycetota bacterium]
MAARRWSNAPLPEPHLAGLGVGILIHLFLSWRLFAAAWVGQVTGWALVVAGSAAALWAMAAAAETNLDRPAQLVVGGPYRFSRNPMYVAWDSMYLGLSFLFNSAWLVLLFPVVVVTTHYVIVRREEPLLEARFGDEYRSYRARVRRYL